MKFYVVFALLFAGAVQILGQQAEVTEMMFGYNFIETTWYTEAEDLELLELYNDLRVADVSDGMDMVGLPD